MICMREILLAFFIFSSLISQGQKSIAIYGTVDLLETPHKSLILAKHVDDSVTYIMYEESPVSCLSPKIDSLGMIALVANVKIFNADSLIYETNTDKHGKFVVNDLACDTLDFIIEINEYLKQSFRVTPDSLIKDPNYVFLLSDLIYFERVEESIRQGIGYNAARALEDIKNGDIFILDLLGFENTEFQKSDYEYLENLFGFKYLCNPLNAPIDYLFEAEEQYNTVVFEYLDSVCDCNFKRKYGKEFKKIWHKRIMENKKK